MNAFKKEGNAFRINFVALNWEISNQTCVLQPSEERLIFMKIVNS